MKIGISEFITQPALNYMRERGYEISFASSNTKEAMIKLLTDCDGLLVRVAPCDKEVIDRAKKLKVIAKHGVGVDNIDVDYATQRGIAVTYTPVANTNSVAEHALYLMMACAKQGYPLDKKLRETGEFSFRKDYIGEELEGKTLGLIGLGRIGQRLAHKAMHGLGMSVVGLDPFVKKESLENGIILLENRDELLACSDYVSLHLPVLPDTKGIINLNALKKMKSTAFLINAARGELIVTDDLVTALKNGIIRGAGIDVFEKEPPHQCPLFALENVVLTPHTAGSAKESLDKMGLHAAMGIHEVLSGAKVSWPFNQVARDMI
ncbi:MAG: hydroxyacid dehydrogenase [Oscillospiraceae bacterium]